MLFLLVAIGTNTWQIKHLYDSRSFISSSPNILQYLGRCTKRNQVVHDSKYWQMIAYPLLHQALFFKFACRRCFNPTFYSMNRFFLVLFQGNIGNIQTIQHFTKSLLTPSSKWYELKTRASFLERLSDSIQSQKIFFGQDVMWSSAFTSSLIFFAKFINNMQQSDFRIIKYLTSLYVYVKRIKHFNSLWRPSRYVEKYFALSRSVLSFR